MATVSAIVARSLRLLRVIDAEDGVPEPFQYIICQEALNAMMARWEADGIPLGWSAVSAPDDPLPAPVEAEKAIAFNLAVEVRPEFGATLDPDVAAVAQRGYSDLLRDVTA
ncbi:MAG: packaged DNA stabilization gp4 family protein, partial [Beijerinckiaceae bacterium]